MVAATEGNCRPAKTYTKSQDIYDCATLKKDVDGEEYITFWVDALLQVTDTRRGQGTRLYTLEKWGLVEREGKAKPLKDGVHLLRLSSIAVNDKKRIKKKKKKPGRAGDTGSRTCDKVKAWVNCLGVNGRNQWQSPTCYA